LPAAIKPGFRSRQAGAELLRAGQPVGDDSWKAVVWATVTTNRTVSNCLEWSKKDVCCGRCGLDIPFVEKDLYEETGMCGWCVQMTRHD
jgi:hypothetical protein